MRSVLASSWLRLLLCALALSVTPRAQAQAVDEAAARARFNDGRNAYDAGDFARALTEFSAAYELSRRPQLLFNIGAVHDRLRHDAEALTHFEQYLAAVPDAPNAKEVQSRIAILRESVAAARREQERRVALARQRKPVIPAPAAPRSTLGPWLLLGGGGALAVGGGVLVALALSSKSRVENAKQDARWSDLHDSYERVRPFSIAGFSLLGVGVAACGTALAWRFWPAREDRPSLSLRVTPQSVSVGGRF